MCCPDVDLHWESSNYTESSALTPKPALSARTRPNKAITTLSDQSTHSMSLAQSSLIEAENRNKNQKLTMESRLMSPPPSKISETILNMFSGKTYLLETYRSLNDKLELIRHAIRSKDSNIITATTLHFKKTVLREIFMKHIVDLEFNDALNHYISYLKQKEKRELITFYDELENHHPDSARVAEFRNEKHILVYQLMHKKEYPEYRNPDALSKIFNHNRHYRDLFQNYQRFGEDSRKLHEIYPERRSFAIEKDSVIGLLHWLCLNHWDAKRYGQNTYDHDFFRKIYNIIDKHYIMTAVRALAERGQFEVIKSLFIKKSFLRGERVLSKLHDWDIANVCIMIKMNCPQVTERVLQPFLEAVTPVSNLLYIAERLHCPAVIIKTLVEKKKDYEALRRYSATLRHGTPEKFLAKQYLDNYKTELLQVHADESQ
ncbi:DgyrCDS8888 [Dimorphilus gyrociliatus]|uniref:DgyrCDS8888 n=1 Tax=Dimorphilus gyrociliatus TaxID=2664684 RepID=A0A7I8VVQ7_9ANNE|nr:DgyrCDS8888 [Dimorphilus gyrociliatus]